MIKYFQKNIIVIISIISLILVLVPSSAYFINFKDHLISEDPAEWGVFGDYIGGTINTVLSLSSLIILGILTYSISKQSNEENKNTNLLIKRMESYDKLAYFYTETFSVMHTMATNVTKFTNLKLSPEIRRSAQIEMERDAIVFTQFFSLLSTFELRFGYLYEYDFTCAEFSELIDEAEKLNVFFENIITLQVVEKDKDKTKMKAIEKLQIILEKLEFELK